MERAGLRRAWLLSLGPALFLLLFFAWPVATIIGRGLSPDALDVLSSARTWRIIGFTVLQATLSTLLTLAIALPAAYALHRLRFPGRRALLALATVPFVLPTVVVGLAFRALLPADWIGGLPAILIAHVFFNYAVVVRIVGGLWGRLDPRYVQVARSLGSSRWRAFTTVTWPLLRPAVAAAASLIFLFTFTSFGVVLILGGPSTVTLEVEIYRRTAQQLDLSAAAALTLLQLVALGVVLAVAAAIQRRAAQQRVLVVGIPVRARGIAERLLLAWVVSTIMVLLVTPMVALVVRSLRVAGGWGLQWWASLGSIDAGTTRQVAPLESLAVSLRTAAMATLLSIVLGGLAAAAIAYSRRGGRVLDTAIMIPLGTSAVTIGFGLLITFAVAPIDLRSSWILIPIAHALVAIPLVIRVILPVARSVDPRLRAVARTLGATAGRAWWDVDRRFLTRPVAVGAALAFAVSLGEFGATAFLARSATPTLPIQIMRLLSRPGEQSLGAAMALATILMVLTVVVMLCVERWRPEGSL